MIDHALTLVCPACGAAHLDLGSDEQWCCRRCKAPLPKRDAMARQRALGRPLILDLFCGAGLVADGLREAGWDVWGVDLAKQRSYPGPILQQDATALDDRFLDAFGAIWASPPCLRDTAMRSAPGAKGEAHPDLISPTRAMLERWAARTGGLYVIENVERAALLNPVILCGSMFGLGADDGGKRFHLERHRKFETNWPLAAPGPCKHAKPVVGVYGGHARIRAASAGGRGTKDPWTRSGADIAREAMGLDRFIPVDDVDQGIPPAYARYVGEQMLAQLAMRRAA